MTTTEAKTVWECVWSNGNPYWMDRNVWTPTDAAPFTAGTSWYDLPQPFWAHGPDGEPLEDLINPEDLVKAYHELIKQGYTHCGGCQFDLEDPDACFGETVLQQALFGEQVFG